MPRIPFPDVPKLAGVPALVRSVTAQGVVRAVLSAAQSALWRFFQVQTRWGIFDSAGKPIYNPQQFLNLPESIVGALGGTTLSTDGVEYSKETRVSDFPLEQGSFAAYNKVELPAEPVVTFAMSGSENDRTQFLNAIDLACLSTDLYSVVTPEKVYINYSIERYSYERKSGRGATLLIVQIGLKEIRQVSAQYAQITPSPINTPKNANATPQSDSGKVQPAAPDTSVLKSLTKKLPKLFGL